MKCVVFIETISSGVITVTLELGYKFNILYCKSLISRLPSDQMDIVHSCSKRVVDLGRTCPVASLFRISLLYRGLAMESLHSCW
jgi:hypothetical protein